MQRHDSMGHWCGYVGVGPGHPWHGKDDEGVGDGAQVHGGITYGRACDGLICHVPEPGEAEDIWWVGFDCAHSGDLSPGTERLLQRAALPCYPCHSRDWLSYKDRSFVQREVERLADQVIEAAALVM